jgi:phosphonate transport system substrate-binding protein
MLGRTRFGVIPLGEGGDARLRAFVTALAGVLESEIDLHHAADYRALASAVEQGLVHFAWLPPLAAARAVRSGAVAPAAIAVRHGATSYYAGLIALESSRVRTTADLRGLRAAWVDRESASGYVVIRAALRREGVSLVDAFKEDLFVRSHAEVARAVESGRADVGATCFNVASSGIQMARSSYVPITGIHGQPLTNVRIVAQAGPIPPDVFAVHRSVAPGVFTKVQTGLVGARPAHLFEAAKALMFADAFSSADAEHLRMLDVLYESVLSESAPRSTPPPRPSFYPR